MVRKVELTISNDLNEAGLLAAKLFMNLRDPERDGHYTTTYWFEDETEINVTNFNQEPDEDDPDDEYNCTLDYEIVVKKDNEFSVVFIGVYRGGEWRAFQQEPSTGEENFKLWMKEPHKVESVFSTGPVFNTGEIDERS